MKANIAYGSKKVEFDNSRAKPTLQNGEVLIKVVASPIQPSDLLNISGGFPTTKFPIVCGRDYSGTVIEPESSSWYGKKVYGTSGPTLSILRDGTHAEFVALPESALAEIPQNLSLAQASLVGTPWTTAWMTLTRSAAQKGETIVVTGAGGNVGSAVVQLAKSSLWGCKVLTAGRGEKYEVDLLRFPDLSIAKTLTEGRGPDIVIDTTGDLKLAAAGLQVLAKRGRLTIITTGASRGSTETTVTVDLKDLYRLEHSIVGCNSLEHSIEETASWLTQIAKGFEAGELTPPQAEGGRIKNITLEEVASAFSEMAGGSRSVYLIENK